MRSESMRVQTLYAESPQTNNITARTDVSTADASTADVSIADASTAVVRREPTD